MQLTEAQERYIRDYKVVRTLYTNTLAEIKRCKAKLVEQDALLHHWTYALSDARQKAEKVLDELSEPTREVTT